MFGHIAFKHCCKSVSKFENCIRGISQQNAFAEDLVPQTQSSLSSGFQFNCSSETLNVIKSSKTFTREQIIPMAAYFDKTGEFPMCLLKKAHSSGLMNVFIPRKFGGLGLSLVDMSLIGEELSYGCAGVALALSSNLLAAAPINLYGNDEQKEKYFGRLISRPLLSSFCSTEHEAGSDIFGMKTTASKVDGGYILDGRKAWITNAGQANWYVVLARTSLGNSSVTSKSKSLTAFIVERNSPGLVVGKKQWNMGQRCADIRHVLFENVFVPMENLLGHEGMGFEIAMKTFDASRPYIAAMAVGLARRVLDETTNWLLQNKSSEEQVYQLKIAEMAIGIETTRLAYIKAGWLHDTGSSNTLLSSVAKCRASDVAYKSANDGLDIFGKTGLSVDSPMEKLLRDAKVLKILEGTSEIQRKIIARELFKSIN